MPEERELLFPNNFCKNNNSNNNNKQRNGLIGVAWCTTPQPCPSPPGMIRGSGYGLTLGFRDWVGPSQTTCTWRGSSPQMRDGSSAWKGGTDQRRYPSPTVVQARHPSSSLWGLGNLVSDEHDILDQLFILDLYLVQEVFVERVRIAKSVCAARQQIYNVIKCIWNWRFIGYWVGWGLLASQFWWQDRLLWAWVCGCLLHLSAYWGLENISSLYSLPLTFLFL